jgi:hypothetical protein
MMNDFVEYWAAAQLLLSGGNPYSPEELLKLQASVGWAESSALIMWNPPWTLVFLWPFGLISYDTAQFIWFLVHTLIIFLGAQVLWAIYGGGVEKKRMAGIAVLTFAPVYFVLLIGQIGPLILLGVIGFLAAAKKESWAWAGASLVLISVKPHLLYLVWLAFFFWVVTEKCWRAVLGLIIAGAIAALLPLAIDGEIYSQYVQLFSASGIVRPTEWATPSLGTALGELFSIRAAWLRWLPTLFGTLWLLWYYRRHSTAWDWSSHLPLISLVSVATASFVWTFDQVVLLPALIQATVWWANTRGSSVSKLILAGYLVMMATALAAKVIVRNDLWYFWLGPMLVLCYLALQKTSARRAKIA